MRDFWESLRIWKNCEWNVVLLTKDVNRIKEQTSTRSHKHKYYVAAYEMVDLELNISIFVTLLIKRTLLIIIFSIWFHTLMPTCHKRFYSFFKGICIFWDKKIIECIFNIHLTIEFILTIEKCCKCLNKWKSVSAKSGEYGGCGRISYNKYLIFLRIIFDECGRALLCTSRTAFLFNNGWLRFRKIFAHLLISRKMFLRLNCSPGLRQE